MSNSSRWMRVRLALLSGVLCGMVLMNSLHLYLPGEEMLVVTALAAAAALDEGLTATRDWPTPRALLLEEEAKSALGAGDAAGEASHPDAANALWSRMGQPGRVRPARIEEYGRMFPAIGVPAPARASGAGSAGS